MATEGFAKAIGRGFKDDKFTTKVQRHLAKAPPEWRRPDCIHPSEISHEDFCPRKIFFRISGVPQEPVPRKLIFEMVFERGHDSHEKWQNWAWDMGILNGFWWCRWCDNLWEDHSPSECPKCEAGRDLIKYAEVPLSNDFYLLAGNADGDVDDHGLIEVKTIGPGTVRIEAPDLVEKYTTEDGIVDWEMLWRGIHRPFRSHRTQGMIYCFCKGRDQMTFIYDPKMVTSYPKEFVVKFKEEYIEDVLEQCLVVKRALAKDVAPKRPLWATKSCRACKECPFKEHCYERKVRTASGSGGVTEEEEPAVEAEAETIRGRFKFSEVAYESD